MSVNPFVEKISKFTGEKARNIVNSLEFGILNKEPGMTDDQEEHEHPFYGYDILRNREQQYIQNLLKKYKNEPVTDDLKKKIWDELQMEKYQGNVTIPFKVAIRKDPSGKFPEYIEVILDTKV